MAATLEPADVMRGEAGYQVAAAVLLLAAFFFSSAAMDTVYSAFDSLVEHAALPDGALWKVETVRGCRGVFFETSLQCSPPPPLLLYAGASR